MWFAPDGIKAEYEYGYNQMPWFDHWRDEHNAVRNDVGLIDLSPFCKIQVEGADAEHVLQRICTNNVAVKAGSVVYTQWLNERAGIEADVTVVRISDTIFQVMTSAATGASEQQWLRKHTPCDAQVTITDVSASQGAFGISGPRARDLLAAYSNIDMSHEFFPFGTSQNMTLGAVPVRAQRISYTGELGWEIFVDTSFAAYLFELLMSGENAEAPTLIGFHAGESLRTEKAYRHWGHDIGYTDTPIESGLLFASKMDKPGGFIGLEGLRKRAQENNQRYLVQFVLEQNDKFLYHNEPIYLHDQLVGSITTGTYGHTFDAPIGLGWIQLPVDISKDALENQSFEILVAGRKVPARASIRPVYDPKNSKIRS